MSTGSSGGGPSSGTETPGRAGTVKPPRAGGAGTTACGRTRAGADGAAAAASSRTTDEAREVTTSRQSGQTERDARTVQPSAAGTSTRQVVGSQASSPTEGSTAEPPASSTE